jgi:hypothetical protein
MRQIEEVRAIGWRESVELRFLSASGRAIDTREVTQWGAALDAPEFEHSDGLRREAFRVALGALADVEPSIVDGTSPWRSLVAEFDRDAGAFGVEFGREADGSPAEEWELDRSDVQRTGIERHLVMRYACTDEVAFAPRLARLDAMAGRAYHLEQMEELIDDRPPLGQQVTHYRARERVARDGWVIERLEGSVADPVAVVESERLARLCVDLLGEAVREAPSGLVGTRSELGIVDLARARLAASHRAKAGRDALQCAARAPAATPAPEHASAGPMAVHQRRAQ